MSTQLDKGDARAAAEARRQKILASRGNRLAKLTNTARGSEGGGVFDNNAPLAALSSSASKADFLGEDPPLPSIPPRPQALASAAAPDPLSPPDGFGDNDKALAALLGDSVPQVDQLTTLMQAMSYGDKGAASSQAPSPRLKLPRLSRWLPFVHGVSIACLVVFAMTALEPRTLTSAGIWHYSRLPAVWERWRRLVSAENTVLDLEVIPVFYIFLALQLALHSTKLVLDRNVPPPPGLIASILPYLPPRLQLYLTGGMKYVAIAEQFLDDIGLLVFLLGVAIWAANL